MYRHEAIDTRGSMVRIIGAEHAGALTMAAGPHLTARALEAASLRVRSKAVALRLLHRRRSGRQRPIKMDQDG